jgi:hypothetical protein
LKSGSFKLLETLGPVQPCNGIALRFVFNKIFQKVRTSWMSYRLKLMLSCMCSLLHSVPWHPVLQPVTNRQRREGRPLSRPRSLMRRVSLQLLGILIYKFLIGRLIPAVVTFVVYNKHVSYKFHWKCYLLETISYVTRRNPNAARSEAQQMHITR